MELFYIHHDADRRIAGDGFTLVELMVVTAIIAVVTAVTLSGQGSFNKSIVLSSTAYDIALMIRSAQTYGLGSRATVGGIKNAGYGIHLAKGTTNSFMLFSDSDTSNTCHGTPPSGDLNAPDAQLGDCVYKAATDGPPVQTYNLNNGIVISDFCTKALIMGAWGCANTNGSSLTSMDIVFARPNTEVFISKNGSYSTMFPDTAACLVLTASQDTTVHRYVSISASGEITANATSCP